MPLRVGLVATTLLLAACGLTASGIAVTSILRHSLIKRVDQTLQEGSRRGWAQAPFGTSRVRSGPTPEGPPSNFYLRAISPDGRTWTVVNDSNAQPALPENNDVGPKPKTVGSVDNSGVQWRAVSVRGPHGQLVTVAYDLSDAQETVRSLVWLQLGIGAAVLVVLGLAEFWSVHRSLRPLMEVEQTAAAIAAGQLDRRVPERDPRTEVGRLSQALNGMLAQIQRALASSESSAEQARNSEDRMRRFITDASHELRTPLTTMRGFAELYRQGASRDMEMMMSRIESESRRMGLLVDDLLLLARLDAQRPIEQNRVDLLSLASDAVHDAQAVAPKRNITMEVVDGPGTPEVLGDEPRLRQVLGNLVTNALQHTPESADITVRVGTEGDDAILEVVDEGPGMSQEDALRIFERFYRTDSSRARISGGSGLGLSIVDSLVVAHDGTVTVTTAPGQGCRFYVSLPRIADVPSRVASGRDDGFARRARRVAQSSRTTTRT
jgi:two-component system, OmpR family, sensor kinase